MHDTIGDRTITHLLEERAALYGGRTFLVFEDREARLTELTYGEFSVGVRRCAAGLAAAGINQGDLVVAHLRNCPEMLLVMFGLARLGAVFVPSNISNTASELEHVINFTEAKMAITQPDLLAPVEQAIAATGLPTTVVIARGSAGDHRTFEDMLDAGQSVPEADVDSTDLAELIFTSGTTRKPKAVMLSHGNCLRAGLDSVHCLWLDEGERCLTALPLFHVNAQALSLFAAMTVAGTTVLLEEFRATRFWSQVRAHGATQTAIVAMQLRTMLAQPPDPDDRDHRLRRVFYAINVSDEEKEEFEARFGVSLINGYGCSEAMTLIACSPMVGPRRWPSVGLPSAGRRVELIGEDGRPVPRGEVGEITVKGTPGRDLMLGYYRDEEATAEALRDGVLHTGDNAYADAEGYLYFFDRKKDMIKRAGENVSASEVEAVLVEHPLIAEAAVVGVPDDIRDEAVAAVVVESEPGALTTEEVVDFCRERLSKFKVPTIVTFSDALPKTSIGKVRKEELRKAIAGDAGPSGADGPSDARRHTAVD